MKFGVKFINSSKRNMYGLKIPQYFKKKVFIRLFFNPFYQLLRRPSTQRFLDAANNSCNGGGGGSRNGRLAQRPPRVVPESSVTSSSNNAAGPMQHSSNCSSSRGGGGNNSYKLSTIEGQQQVKQIFKTN